MERERDRDRDRDRERERDKFCLINVKYKEISWRVRRRKKIKKRKKVTSRSTEKLVLKNTSRKSFELLNVHVWKMPDAHIYFPPR